MVISNEFNSVVSFSCDFIQCTDLLPRRPTWSGFMVLLVYNRRHTGTGQLVFRLLLCFLVADTASQLVGESAGAGESVGRCCFFDSRLHLGVARLASPLSPGSFPLLFSPPLSSLFSFLFLVSCSPRLSSLFPPLLLFLVSTSLFLLCFLLSSSFFPLPLLVISSLILFSILLFFCSFPLLSSLLSFPSLASVLLPWLMWWKGFRFCKTVSVFHPHIYMHWKGSDWQSIVVSRWFC